MHPGRRCTGCAGRLAGSGGASGRGGRASFCRGGFWRLGSGSRGKGGRRALCGGKVAVGLLPHALKIAGIATRPLRHHP